MDEHWKKRKPTIVELVQLVIGCSVVIGWFSNLRATDIKVTTLENEFVTIQRDVNTLQSQLNHFDLNLAVSDERLSNCCRRQK